MRSVAWLFRGLGLLALGAGVVVLLQQWINWLQSGQWPSLSMLRLLHDASLLSTQWYIYPGNTQILHDFLSWVPAGVGLTSTGYLPADGSGVYSE